MAFRSNAERMEIMHSMCKREFEQLQANLSKFVLDSEAIMGNDIFKNFRRESRVNPTHTNVFALLAYDRYMSLVAAAINLARKFNIHLQLHNLNKVISSDVGVDISPVSYLLEEFVEWHNVLNKDERCHSHINEWKSLRSEVEGSRDAISVPFDTNDICTTEKEYAESYPILRKITFAIPESSTMETWPSCVQLLNLSAYVAGYRFEAFITYIDNVAALSFYTCQMRNDLLYELSNMINLPKSVRMPPPNVIFGISINSKSILRGVLQESDCSNDDNYQILLIDYGELVPLYCNDVQFYDLPKIYRELPAQAIKCVLLGIKKAEDNVETEEDILRSKLRHYEFKEVNIEVIRKTGRVLCVNLIERGEFGKPKDQARKVANVSTNPFINSFDENIKNDIHSERVKFGSNNNLMFLSTPRINDVFKNDVVQLEVMHIGRPDCFYGQILKDKTEQLEQLFWNSEEVAIEDKLMEPPELGDVILAQYDKDKLWYRAKVIGKGDDDDVYKVFYVDYGNTEMIPLKKMLKCNNVQAMEPFRAVLCRFAGINDTTNGDKFRFDQAVQMLVITLLNQRIEARVVEKISDQELIVRLLDTDFDETTQMMIDLGYVQQDCMVNT